MLDLRSLYTMLKVRIILISVLLLLFGVNSNVRANVDSNKSIQKAKDKGESEKESQEREHKETITELDFFGAFSLVNVQLQWRDLHIGLIDEAKCSKSKINRKQLPLEEVKTLPLEINEQVAPSSPIVHTGGNVIPIFTYRAVDGTTHFIYHQTKQHTSIIAYILNCGTYPLSC